MTTQVCFHVDSHYLRENTLGVKLKHTPQMCIRICFAVVLWL